MNGGSPCTGGIYSELGNGDKDNRHGNHDKDDDNDHDDSQNDDDDQDECGGDEGGGLGTLVLFDGATHECNKASRGRCTCGMSDEDDGRHAMDDASRSWRNTQGEI